MLYDLALAPNIEVDARIHKLFLQLRNTSPGIPSPFSTENHRYLLRHMLPGSVRTIFRAYGGFPTSNAPLSLPKGGTYDFQLKKEKGYRGKYYAAAGITYGYVRPLARHLAIEFSVGIGYLDTEYRKYTSYGNDLVWVSSGKYHFIGPTKAKISLVWLLTSGR